MSAYSAQSGYRDPYEQRSGSPGHARPAPSPRYDAPAPMPTVPYHSQPLGYTYGTPTRPAFESYPSTSAGPSPYREADSDPLSKVYGSNAEKAEDLGKSVRY